jgi:hypothetical protein
MFQSVLQGLLANPAHSDLSEEELVQKAATIADLSESYAASADVAINLPVDGWVVGLADGNGSFVVEPAHFVTMDRCGRIRFFELSQHAETVEVSEQAHFLGCWHPKFGSDQDRDDFFSNEADVWTASQMQKAREAAAANSIRRVK